MEYHIDYQPIDFDGALLFRFPPADHCNIRQADCQSTNRIWRDFVFPGNLFRFTLWDEDDERETRIALLELDTTECDDYSERLVQFLESRIDASSQSKVWVFPGDTGVILYETSWSVFIRTWQHLFFTFFEGVAILPIEQLVIRFDHDEFSVHELDES